MGNKEYFLGRCCVLLPHIKKDIISDCHASKDAKTGQTPGFRSCQLNLSENSGKLEGHIS